MLCNAGAHHDPPQNGSRHAVGSCVAEVFAHREHLTQTGFRFSRATLSRLREQIGMSIVVSGDVCAVCCESLNFRSLLIEHCSKSACTMHNGGQCLTKAGCTTGRHSRCQEAQRQSRASSQESSDWSGGGVRPCGPRGSQCKAKRLEEHHACNRRGDQRESCFVRLHGVRLGTCAGGGEGAQCNLLHLLTLFVPLCTFLSLLPPVLWRLSLHSFKQHEYHFEFRGL